MSFPRVNGAMLSNYVGEYTRGIARLAPPLITLRALHTPGQPVCLVGKVLNQAPGTAVLEASVRALGAGRRWAHASAEIRRSRPRFTNGMVLQNSNATSPPLLRPRQDGANVNVQLASGNPGFNTSFCEARGAPRGRSPARAGGEGIQFEGCSGTQVVAVVTDTGNVEEQRSSELGDTFGASHAHASVHSAVSNGTTSRTRRHAELPAVHAPRERPLPGHVLEYAAAVRGTCEPAWAGTWASP